MGGKKIIHCLSGNESAEFGTRIRGIGPKSYCISTLWQVHFNPLKAVKFILFKCPCMLNTAVSAIHTQRHSLHTVPEKVGRRPVRLISELQQNVQRTPF